MTPAQRDALKAFMRATAIPPDEAARVLRAASDAGTAAESYLPTRAVCGQLECAARTVFRYEQQGRLHAVRRSARCVRWRKSEVDALLHGGTRHD